MIVSSLKQHQRTKAPLNLVDDLYYFAQRTPEALALFCHQGYSYRSLATAACQVGEYLRKLGSSQVIERVAVLGERSFVSYAGVLGTLWAGCGYIPLVASQPAEHLQRRINKADVQVILVDQAGQAKLSELSLSDNILLCVLTEDNQASQAVVRQTEHPSLCALTLASNSEQKLTTPKAVAPETIAYIIFTSGSTGEPKGCAPNYYQVACFIDAMCEDFSFLPSDRFGQFCELGFDASVFILYTALRVGASCFVIPVNQRLTAVKFLAEHHISVIYIMPSVVNLMQQSRQLTKAKLPELRLTFFGAELLTQTTAAHWQRVAPNGHIENKYGPTESTVSCASAAVEAIEFTEKQQTTSELARDLLSIGKPLAGLSMAVVDQDRQFLPAEQVGEIVIAGEQVLTHYWRDQQQTEACYVKLPGSELLWYLSGDLGYVDANGRFYVLGRTDNQIQLRGQRLELSFIHMLLRQYSGVEEVVAIPWPIKDGNVIGLVAFIESETIDLQQIFAELRKRLIRSSLPNRIIGLKALPRNNNGKIDRQQLTKMLDNNEFN